MARPDATYQTKNYEEQGGAGWVVGGDLEVVSGGDIVVDNGAVLDASAANAADVKLPAGLTVGTAGVIGAASGYKLARGVHQIAAASDTVATGLATVVAVVVSFQDAPTANIVIVGATIGDQAGTPAAGSILIKAYKTASSPVAATTFSDAINVNWIAVGT